MDGSGRTARLVLVADGAVLGVLPPLQLALPWWREAADVVAAALPPDQRAPLSALVTGVPTRIAAIDAWGVPNTLVHGDFHPGNVVGPPDACVLLDRGDFFGGNPLIDEPAFTERLDEEGRADAR